MTDFSIQQEKVAQAVSLLNELKIDAWLTFVRETSHIADPALGLIMPLDLTWQAALIVSRSGQKIVEIPLAIFDYLGSSAVEMVLCWDTKLWHR